jgi:hypothetical protein
MRFRLGTAVIAAFTLLGAGAPAFAHHGFTVEFDATKCMDLKGTLTGLDWDNPHAYFHMDVTDSDGQTHSWSLEMVTPNALKRNGTTRQDFVGNFGKTINARICPTKAGGTPYRGSAEYLALPDGVVRPVGQGVERRAPEDKHF